MAKPKSPVLPIVALPRDLVLLPGSTLRIPLQSRPDIANLLASIYSRATTPKPENAVTIGCVPLCSPQLSRDGKKLIEDGKASRNDAQYSEDPAQASPKDLFSYGTTGKVSGVQGRRQGELSLVVEGVSRFKLGKVIQEKPFLEAEIIYHEDEGKEYLGRFSTTSTDGIDNQWTWQISLYSSSSRT